MAATSLLKVKSFCVITGASRGYGRCIAEKLATNLPKDSTFLLLARDTQQLATVKENINTLNDSVQVMYEKFDQSSLNECSQSNIRNILSKNKIEMKNFDQILIIHNAGTVGDLTKFAWEMTDISSVETAMNLNVTGTILLNAALLSEVRNSNVGFKVVINISSLAAVQAFSSWSVYCSGKAARDMFFQTLAKEDSTIKVLNWAPGPLDTDMQKQCRQSADDTIRQLCNVLFYFRFIQRWQISKM
ncbi:hypothetical protein ACF0H5_018034 [Mactra antiquata]